MMSDEMRELVSAYVDDELRDTDAARVEELSKRDPELRHEIEAYRKLRRKLKDWDAADHGHAPSPALRQRALARVRALVKDRRTARRGRIVAILFSPIAAAAALLLAVGTGLLASWPAPPSGTPVAGVDADFVVTPAQPLPDLTLDASALRPYEEPRAEVAGSGFKEVVDRRMRAIELQNWMMQQQDYHDRMRDRLALNPERRTGPPANMDVVTMLTGPRPADRPMEALFILEQPEVVRSLPATVAAPLGKRLGMDHNTTAGRVYVDLRQLTTPTLSPLGEVWIGSKDGSGRTRIVSASQWIKNAELVPVVWADKIAAPKTRNNLEVQNFILGPEARRRLLAVDSAVEPVFRAWLSKRYGGRTLTEAFARDASKRDRDVSRMVASLGRNQKANGFAVVNATGKLMGVELFANHSLMMQFAPRLLRGYLLEAGHNGVRLTPSVAASVAQLKDFLEDMKRGNSRMEKIEVGSTHGWVGTGLERVEVRRNGTILGHGLLDGKKNPVHVTIFGE